ncbi:transposase [Adlercreutzia caecimuris]|uniref:transposase n=1 Tax=Adlercreutzia caecimuris TaxID=671266 RepID=UPI002585CF2E|nr:transposase [Adlercreutzia caecimuris]
MLTEAATCNAVIGLDVAKFSPWVCHVSRRDEVPGSGPVANTAHELDELFGQATPGRWSPECRVMAENTQLRALARRIRESPEEEARLDAEIAALLAEDGTCSCLLSVPGIGPGTASEPVISISIGGFPDHDRLASYRGIASGNRQSSKSISSASSSRQGNKRLKNLLIFSCNSLSRSKGRFGDCYCRCRGLGMCHGEALKAVGGEEAEGDLRN